jgi:hypothetical protein
VVARIRQTIIPRPLKARVSEICGPKCALIDSYGRVVYPSGKGSPCTLLSWLAIIPGWRVTQINMDIEGPRQGKVSWIREPFLAPLREDDAAARKGPSVSTVNQASDNVSLKGVPCIP